MRKRGAPMSRRGEILEKVDAMPALPASASEVLALIDDTDCGIGEIIEVIRADAALTAELLRLANSSYFAGPRKVGDLRGAGVLMGKSKLRQLVLACAVFPLARQPVQGYGLSGGALLEHSLAVAIGTEEAARMKDRDVASHAFTAGLLHDLGKIVLGTFIEIDAGPMLALSAEKGIPFDQAEREVLGIDHAEAGAALLDKWNFPEALVIAARWHHAPETLDPPDFVTDCVHVCDMISIESGLGAGVDGLNYVPSASTLERLGMTSDAIERLACAMLTDLKRMKSDLDENAERD